MASSDAIRKGSSGEELSGRVLTYMCVAVAVVSASVAGIVVTNNRTAAARAALARAESEEATAKYEARRAASEQAAEEAKAAKAEADRKKEEAAAERAKDERAQAEADAARAKDERKKAEDEAEAVREARQKAADEKEIARENARMTNVVAMAAVEKARFEAKKAEAEAKKKASELKIAEDKKEAQERALQILELKKEDFRAWERKLRAWAQNLAEIQRDLEEREAALTPDRTASDLQWVEEGELDVIGETNVVRRKERMLPENDLRLPAGARRLALAERLRCASLDDCVTVVASNRVVAVLAKRMAEAEAVGRVVEAAYYLKGIRMYYPDWGRNDPKLRPAESAPAQKKEEE